MNQNAKSSPIMYDLGNGIHTRDRQEYLRHMRQSDEYRKMMIALRREDELKEVSIYEP